MSGEQKTVVAIAFAIALTLTSLCWAIAYQSVAKNKAAIEAGHSQQSLPGQTGVYWVKVEE